MNRVFASAAGATFTVFLTSCSTLQPDVQTSGNYPVSWSDVREIERLLPIARTQHPIREIQRFTPDEVTVLVAPLSPRPGRHGYSFIALRRHGRWFLDKASIKPSYTIYLD